MNGISLTCNTLTEKATKMLSINSGRFWVTGTVTADCAWHSRCNWQCQRGASLHWQLFHYLFCSMMGPWVGFCLPSLELLKCLNSRPFSKHLSSGLHVIHLFRSVTHSSTYLVQCSELEVTYQLQFSALKNPLFSVYTVVWATRVTHVQVIQNISPQRFDFQICYQLEKLWK